MGGTSAGSIANDVFNPIGALIGQGVKQAGGNPLAQTIANPGGAAAQQAGNTLFGGSGGQPPTYQPGGNSGFNTQPGSSPSIYGSNNGDVQFSYQGLPGNFPGQALPEAYQNISNLYGSLGQQSPGYYNQAQQATTQAQNQGIGNINNIYGGGLGTQQSLTNQAIPESQALTGQSMGNLNSVLNNYDQNFIQQLGPSGQLGQQLMGEFNNYGITPQSGAFQAALGNQLGTLGGQNQLALGSQLVNQGGQAQQNLLSQGLGGQLSTAQQGTQQAGQLANLGGIQNMTLGSEGALSPLNYLNQAGNAQAGIINQAGNLPIDYWGSLQNQNFAQSLASQNQAAQNQAAQAGLLGNLGGAGIGAAGSLLAAGK